MQTGSCPALDAWIGSVDDLLAEPTNHHQPAGDQPELIGKLWAKLHKERDLELHLRVGWLAGTEFVQLLDFVPSIDRYETSFMIETRLLSRLLGKLLALHRYSGGTAASLG